MYLCRSTAAALFSIVVLGCSSNNSSPTTTDGGGGGGGMVDSGGAGNAQTPPMGMTAVEAWIAGGAYKSWACESAVHASRSPSPHGFNRICSNDVISSNATATTAWPAGAAAVKELWASDPNDTEGGAPPTAPVGYAVYLKTASDSAAGANWYWYERVPLDSAAPHDANGVVADGLGSSGPAQTICVACHSAAGSDTAHTPSANGHDEVDTPVP
jgi:cytochrome P460